MAIDGINGAYHGPSLTRGPHRRTGTDGARGEAVKRPAQPAAGDAFAVRRAPSGTVPAEAPRGTDPTLWSVLTSEERAFFTKARAMGPLTYGPGSGRGGAAAVLLGGRLDVKV